MSRLAPSALALRVLVCAVGVGVGQLVGAPSVSAAHPLDEFTPCAAGPVVRHLHAGPAATREVRSLPPVQVDVYVHVLRSRSEGNVSTHRIRRQIAVMSGAYAGKQSADAARSPFVFRLAGVDRTRNGRWYRMNEGTVAEGHAKRTLHLGGPSDLNLYVGMNRSGSLGWGTAPGAVTQAPRMDGVVIRRSSMPGGRGGHYSSGDAAVHETGHWLGLLHTFAGKCGKRGDLVSDTPAEARPSYTCPVRRNTCTAPGRDPVHNFMDYSYDACMNQFTAGQVLRMRDQWTDFRAGGD